MLYTTCKYAPEELFSGFGVPTMRLDPNPVSFSCADGCAHPNLCGFAKAVIEEVRMRDVRELIITDCCDAMRRTYDVLSGQQLDFLWFLPLPHKSGPAEVRMFAKYLKELADAYGKYLGRPFSAEDALAACRTSQSITAPEDAALKDIAPENATSENAAPEDVALKDTLPENATSENAGSGPGCGGSGCIFPVVRRPAPQRPAALYADEQQPEPAGACGERHKKARRRRRLPHHEIL